MPKGPTDRAIMEAYLSNICPACYKWKRGRNAFCSPCYKSLPQYLRSALWRHFRSGFETVFRTALKHLQRELWSKRDTRLDFSQDEQENRRAFIARLTARGWSLKAASQEWLRIQDESED